MKIILAFLLIFSDGEFKGGVIDHDKSWTTIEQCREDMKAAQSKLAAQGVTSKAGCFEVEVPKPEVAI